MVQCSEQSEGKEDEGNEEWRVESGEWRVSLFVLFAIKQLIAISN